jgi:hypothetical protein
MVERLPSKCKALSSIPSERERERKRERERERERRGMVGLNVNSRH